MAPRVLKAFLYFVLITVAVADAADNSFKLSMGEFNATSREARIERGKALTDEIRRLADLIRSPSPSEVEWVNSENAAIDKLTDSNATFARTLQLTDSPEFQQVKMYNYITSVGNSLACIVDQKVELKTEILCWGSLSFLLSDSLTLDDGIRVLLRSKRLPDKPLEELSGSRDSSGVSFKYRLLSRNIQQNVVLPYLRGEIKR